MIILGIETSCDETSVAILNNKEVISSFTFSQADIHAVFGGVVPEVASRNHLMKIKPLFDKALAHAGMKAEDIDLIAVTSAPGLIGSLFVGVSFAKGLAYALDKPIMDVHHLAGHILSAELSDSSLKPPYIALVVSGGHTHIYKVTDKPLNFTLLGRTIDDAAGEAFDKVSKMLGGSYPGGPFVEKLAVTGNNAAIPFPIALKKEDNFSFSGLKTAVLNQVQRGDYSAEDIAASFQHTVAKTLYLKTSRIALKEKINSMVVSGGVACNKALRNYFSENGEKDKLVIHFPAFDLCNDNAAMIAYAAYRMSEGVDINIYKDLGFAAGDTRHEISAP